eukprot:3841517-Pyramimonas_sp.AAC.1
MPERSWRGVLGRSGASVPRCLRGVRADGRGGETAARRVCMPGWGMAPSGGLWSACWGLNRSRTAY